ncbi:hypothetical protein F5Y14DRAFT_422435 [Nemania sp. NC0429]|nr:hypothetical protein F5Y14DRAFT_422435 [Nemania sp. NC0429]
MASSSVPATTADTLISLKANLDGATHRFKLPLRDLGVVYFEARVRAALQIPIDTAVVIERWSDSATSYVVLHSANTYVYKQLYRAAKAKQKLKLRITTKPTEPIEPVKKEQTPKPVTIEDLPEEDVDAFATMPGLEAVPDDTPVSQVEAHVEAQKHLGKEVDILKFDNGAADEMVASALSGLPILGTVRAPRTKQDFPYFVQQWRAQGNPRIRPRQDADGTEVIDFIAAAARGVNSLDLPDDASSHVSLAELMRKAHSNDSQAMKARLDATLKKLHNKQSKANLDDVVDTPKPTTPVIKQNEEAKDVKVVKQQDCMKRPFTVCCNSCDRAVPEAHFHCSICDEGDFDLCPECVNRGISCYGEGHWLIKRTIVNGDIKCSSTHIAPKSAPKPTPVPPVTAVSNLAAYPLVDLSPLDWNVQPSARTCNSCVREFEEAEFVHCTTCEDYDLCKSCFAKNQHGHHPKHGFAPAVDGTTLDHTISSRLEPGRNVLHNAICDGCDKYVRGIRHKCLDCPDWDYCSDCVKDADFIHAGHRFVAVYEPLADRLIRTSSRATHHGISCDGPLCAGRQGGSKYIVGERYKCAVCHDTDFCANCEASPANTHNKTHPLIKFKTPVRHVSVTTTGEHEDGQRLPTMGDRCYRSRTSTQSLEKPVSTRENIVATPVQTVVDVQPTEHPEVLAPSQSDPVEIKEETLETKTEISEIKSSAPLELPKESSINEGLVAIFSRDTIQDGSVFPPNHTFEQTWVLRNEGTVPWPAGCAVKFVGGDYMGAVDPAHPAGIHELVSASESTVCYNPLSPGQEFSFTVLMRTPDRDGKVISYWRLTTPDGVKFGHKLWCDVNVQTPPKAEQVKARVLDVPDKSVSSAVGESRMIIPKLEHESPSGSIHEGPSEVEAETETDTLAPSVDDDDFEDCGGQDDWAEDSDSGFLTDEEYDILDASDEEILFEQQRKLFRN